MKIYFPRASAVASDILAMLASDSSGRAQPADRNMHQNTSIPEIPSAGHNVLKSALKTLRSVSSNIPFGSMLSSVIDTLLDITDHIEVRIVTVATQWVPIYIPANIGQRTRSY